MIEGKNEAKNDWTFADECNIYRTIVLYIYYIYIYIYIYKLKSQKQDVLE